MPAKGMLSKKPSSSSSSSSSSQKGMNQKIDEQDCPVFARQLAFHDKENIEFIGDCLTSSGPSMIRPHWSESPLTSSGLLATTIAQRMMRNDEQFSSPNIKAFEGLAIAEGPGSSPNVGLWSHRSEQRGRIEQCHYVIARLKERRAVLELGAFSGKAVEEELKNIRKEIELIESIIKGHEPVLKGSLHPISLENNSNTDGGVCINNAKDGTLIPSPISAIRGFMVALRGPKRGQKACKWQKTAGKISVSSAAIMSSESKVPINTRIGVFGCTIRIVWGKMDLLFGSRNRYRLIDSPPASYIKEKELVSGHRLGDDQAQVAMEMMSTSSFRDPNWVLMTDGTKNNKLWS